MVSIQKWKTALAFLTRKAENVVVADLSLKGDRFALL